MMSAWFTRSGGLVKAGGARSIIAAAIVAMLLAGCGATGGSVAAECWKDSNRVESSGDGAYPQWKKPPAMTIDAKKHYTATLTTNKGAFDVEFFPDDAPKTVNNFVCLARAGYYDGTPIHRIVSDFVIQGGDPTGTGSGGPGYRFEDEPVKRPYEIGTLAMANSGPDTNGSQFFVVTGENGTQLPSNYTIFGKVSQGMDVVEAIAETATDVNPDTGEKSVPIETITLERVTVTES